MVAIHVQEKNKRLFVDWNHVALVILGAGVGLVGILLYASSFPWSADEGPERGPVIGSAIMFALASTLAGGLLGFLFGVPRSLTSEGGPASGTSPPAATGRYAGNTNLEQVSDWLTKLLLGATLVQLPTVGRAAGRLFDNMSESLGGGDNSTAFAGALVVYFATLGFLLGWLATRLFLAPALNRADLEIVGKLKAAEVAERSGDPATANRLRGEALEKLARAAAPLGEQYRTVRSERTGPARTVEQERLLEEARRLTEAMPEMSGDDLRKLFDTGTPLNRVLALSIMRKRPAVADLWLVKDVIENSQTAFEQYHAYLTAEAVANNGLDPEMRAMLAETVRQSLEGERAVLLDEERRELARRVLRLLEP